MEEKNNQKEKEITLDDLATIVQGSILELGSELKSDIKSLEDDIKGLKDDVKGLKDDVKEVKSDTEDIKAELNKKVDTITHNTLTYRVEKLEEKFA